MFGLVSRGQLLMAVEVTAALRKDLRAEREEVKRLTNVIIQLRQQGFSLGPEHTDQRWPGGRYIMEEYERSTARESEPELPSDPLDAMVMEKMLADDLMAAFPDEDED